MKNLKKILKKNQRTTENQDCVESSIDYLHNSSICDYERVGCIQCIANTICYHVEYHPTTPVNTSKTWDINISASEDLTELSNRSVYAKLLMKKRQEADLEATDVVQISCEFASCLFQQLDIFPNGVNIAQETYLYHHQAFIEKPCTSLLTQTMLVLDGRRMSN